MLLPNGTCCCSLTQSLADNFEAFWKSADGFRHALNKPSIRSKLNSETIDECLQMLDGPFRLNSGDLVDLRYWERRPDAPPDMVKFVTHIAMCWYSLFHVVASNEKRIQHARTCPFVGCAQLFDSIFNQRYDFTVQHLQTSIRPLLMQEKNERRTTQTLDILNEYDKPNDSLIDYLRALPQHSRMNDVLGWPLPVNIFREAPHQDDLIDVPSREA